MVKYTLEQLTNELTTNPQLAGRVFSYHANNNRYGLAAAAAGAVPENARNYAQRVDVATARTRFDAERANPHLNSVLLETYLPIYSQERNQRNWNNAKIRAAAFGIGGLVLLLLSSNIDSKTAKFLAEAAGAAAAVGSPIGLGIAYFRYRA